MGVVGHNPLFSVAIPASVAPATLETLAAFATDAYITISLCVILRGRRTGIRKTENVIATLVIYAINRGIFTAYVANFMTINGAHISVLFQALPTGAFYHLHLLQDAVVILVDDRPRPGHSAICQLITGTAECPAEFAWADGGSRACLHDFAKP